MELIEQIKQKIQSLDEKEFLTYLLGTIGTVTVVVFFMLFFFYRRTTFLKKHIQRVNTTREDVRKILDKYEIIEQKQKAIDQRLEENKNFKIRGYFESLLSELDLTNKKSSELETTKTEQDTKYIETTLTASLGDMSMKQTCQLLDKLEQNRIIYTKELEIAASKKRRQKVSIQITIATLQPIETTELTE